MPQVKCGCWTEATFNKAANLPEEFTGVNLHDEKCIVPAAVEKISAERNRLMNHGSFITQQETDRLDGIEFALDALAALSQMVEP